VAKRATKKAATKGGAGAKRAGAASGNGARKAKSTSNNYARWTRAEVKVLRQLAAANTPTPSIGRKLGRTAISIQGKAQREGISVRATTQSRRAKRK
jgi:hypothetical protein